VATLGVALLGGCGGSDSAVAPSTSAASRSAPPASSTVSTVASSTAGTSDATVTASVTPSGPGSGTSLAGTPIEFAQLLEAGADTVGETVTVRARAFFLEQCPPPSTVPSTPCSLSLFVTEPERDHLLYGERSGAIAVFDADGRVTCHVGNGVTTECPGWVHGALYDLTGVVVTTAGAPGVELHLSGFERVTDGSG